MCPAMLLSFSFGEYLRIEDSGNMTLENGEFYAFVGDKKQHISIEINLPDGWCDTYGDDTIPLTIDVSLSNGIESARVLGSVIKDN